MPVPSYLHVIHTSIPRMIRIGWVIKQAPGVAVSVMSAQIKKAARDASGLGWDWEVRLVAEIRWALEVKF
jgi:hypothetical protein